MEIATIGLDLAKHWFQVHGVDAEGRTVVRKRLRRREVIPFFASLPRCLVGAEACATAHYWARELKDLGHEVRLMPPGYVKPFVRRQAKNDAADAAAICEAVTRPNMRFVSVKSPEQRGFLMLHRARGLLVRQRTMTACAIRAHLAEFGVVAGQARQRVEGLIALLEDETAIALPAFAREALDGPDHPARKPRSSDRRHRAPSGRDPSLPSDLASSSAVLAILRCVERCCLSARQAVR